MTTRGCVEKDFVQIMEFLNKGTDIATKISKETKSTKLKDFKDTLGTGKWDSEIDGLRKEVKSFANQFEVPGGLI